MFNSLLSETSDSMLRSGGLSTPAWGFFTTIVIALSGIVVEMIRTRRKVEKTIELSEPTGNGFVPLVIDMLQDNAIQLTTIRDEVSHLGSRISKLEERNDYVDYP